jgi:tetratricopeptide (TPR) repeat protein
LADVPGLDATKKKVGLYEKYIKNFKTLPPKQKAIVAAVGLALVYFLVFDEPAPEPVAKTPAKPVAAKTEKGPVTFESLSPDQKRFVEAQHALAFDHYRNKDYDKALYEVRKIFNFVPDYKDSKEIERYAMEGKRKLEAIEEEARKKEEEARMKAQIAQLLEETRAKMEKKQYEQATELFIQLLTLDPENEQVAKWKKEIEDYEEQKRLDAQAVAVQEEINQKAWEIFREAQGLKKNGKCHSAIELFRKIPDIGSSDKSVVIKASAGIKSCFAFIRNRREPLLQQAKGAEDAQDYSKAFKLYKQATVVDPPHRAGYAGMSRIRNVLHEKAKLIYTEAILAESYSDFAFAKKKFNEILTFAPEDDIYYERARHKLSFYFRKDEGQ